MSNYESYMQKLSVDVITTLREYFKNFDDIIANYRYYSCYHHPEKQKIKIVSPGAIDTHGIGPVNGEITDWSLYTSVTCEVEFECGDVIRVGFMFHYTDLEWNQIKEKLSNTVLSQENIDYLQLAENSYYEFFNGRFSSQQPL